MRLGRPSRVRDTIGAVLLVVVGVLYVSGVSEVRGSDATHEATFEAWEASPAAKAIDVRG